MEIVKEKKKSGKLSLEEEQFIRDNVDKLPIKEIAEHINRTEVPVLRYMRENNLISVEMDSIESARTILRSKLHTREYWTEIKKQFTPDELICFEADWTRLMLQFKEDLQYAEELELKQFITLEILINRNLTERQIFREEAEKLQKLLDKEYEVDESIRDITRIANLEAQLSCARTAIPSYMTEYAKLLEKRQNITRDLKATRDQRIKRIDDSKTTWTGFLKALDDETIRSRVGDDIELMRLAKNKARDRLSELHEYVDGKFDRPILNSETIELDQEDGDEIDE